ncbi:hypothetical protein [Rhodococcus sp. 14-2470-1a]|uniref:hypothetical protein n=1 Tax=Rhodococcus sp. 14-2470-1a TaxID=2023150 RepID=UPI000B9A823F|nr:hypothetical protein [Rhodococcus sp. 14-2470-1a]OZF41926.1 hypothetical protein CH292_27355 [Rhodococcus sp. 14-2470-1a]
MSPAARWIQRKAEAWLRLKALALLVTAVSCFGIGTAYLVPSAPDRPRQLTFVETIAPLHVFAWLWVAVGAACLASIVCRRMRPAMFGFAAFLHAMWGLSFSASYVFLDNSDRDWVSARGYLVIAGLILVAAGIKEGSRRWGRRSLSR